MKLLIPIIAAVLLCGCNEPASFHHSEVLPDGTTVKCYHSMVNGNHHFIYVTDGAKTTTDNRPGKGAETTITIEKR